MSRNERGSAAIIVILILLIILILIALYYFFVYQGSPDNDLSSVSPSPTTSAESSSAPMFNCRSTKDSSVETVSGYDEIKLVGVYRGDGGGETELTEVPAISLSEFEESDWPEYDVVYSVTKDKRLYTGFWGVATGIEVCDENNQTNVPLEDTENVDLIEEDSPAAMAASYIQGGHIPAEPGTYRVDGYLFYDGDWHLTHQFQDVVFTE